MLRLGSSSKYHPLHSRRRVLRIPLGAQRFLAAFEGFEGGFAIGASILVALSFSDLPREVLLSTALISIIVNGFNTASVKYSSEHYLDELDGREKRDSLRHYFVPSFIEFLAYFTISFVSVVPLMLIDDISSAVWMSVIITLTLLLGAGYWRGYMLKMSRWRDALETSLLGGGIIAVGFISGLIVRSL